MTAMPVPLKARAPSFAELFTPKLVTVFREGYTLRDFRADAIAGLTVAIVALPLSMAIAIASGLPPQQGLFTAIIGGTIISLLGGCRFQIGGPAGAFIVLVYSIVEKSGPDGLAIATIIAGIFMILIGALRFGTYIKFIPLPVTVGFTAGIAVIIFASQIKDILGLPIPHEPAALLPKLAAVAHALPGFNPSAAALAFASLATILILRRLRPAWPGMLIAVAGAALAAAVFHLDVATIHTRFGAIPNAPPAPALPPLSLAKLQSLLPDAASIALLGAIESLLSAVVADGMTGRRHRSNCELVAQGVANIAATLFAGMPVTGAVARTATNIRAGARGPVAGILHAAFLLVFMLAAAPLTAYIPLATLGAVLAIVAWNMVEKAEFRALLTASRGDAAVLLVTFLLTIFVDLTTGIGVGVTLGAFLFLERMAEAVDIRHSGQPSFADRPDSELRGRYDPEAEQLPGIEVYRLHGALFFGATAAINLVLDHIGPKTKALILDVAEVPLIDSTAAKSLARLAHKLVANKSLLIVAGATPAIRHTLRDAGLTAPTISYAHDIAAARRLAASHDSRS